MSALDDVLILALFKTGTLPKAREELAELRALAPRYRKPTGGIFLGQNGPTDLWYRISGGVPQVDWFDVPSQITDGWTFFNEDGGLAKERQLAWNRVRTLGLPIEPINPASEMSAKPFGERMTQALCTWDHDLEITRRDDGTYHIAAADPLAWPKAVVECLQRLSPRFPDSAALVIGHGGVCFLVDRSKAIDGNPDLLGASSSIDTLLSDLAALPAKPEPQETLADIIALLKGSAWPGERNLADRLEKAAGKEDKP